MLPLSPAAADWPQFRGAQQQQRQPRRAAACQLERDGERRLEGCLARPRTVEPDRGRRQSDRHLLERHQAGSTARRLLRREDRPIVVGAAILGHRPHAQPPQQRQCGAHAGQRRQADLCLLLVERSGVPGPRRQSEVAARPGVRFSARRQRRRHVVVAVGRGRPGRRAGRMPGRLVRHRHRQGHRRKSLADRPPA